ncbi:MAG: ABC transporter ATP-binding protein [Christensenellales bacterium]|jgi:putative ABC transport system ATP-binding protein
MLKVINVYKTFENGGSFDAGKDTRRMVLKGVSLDIQKGDFVSIMGASGSGKSTLLTIMGGIDRPTAGEVYFQDRCISNLPESQLAVLRRTKIGFVFQFFNLAPYLSVEENILLPIILDGKKVRDYAGKAAELMKYLGIAEYKNSLPGKLSGGEQQRVAIAKGLISDPDVILLDEPTGNLDSVSAEDIMRLLVKINNERGTTIVQVTHSEHNALYASKIYHIKDGQIIA